jgi:hypothetical protein
VRSYVFIVHPLTCPCVPAPLQKVKQAESEVGVISIQITHIRDNIRDEREWNRNDADHGDVVRPMMAKKKELEATMTRLIDTDLPRLRSDALDAQNASVADFLSELVQSSGSDSDSDSSNVTVDLTPGAGADKSAAREDVREDEDGDEGAMNCNSSNSNSEEEEPPGDGRLSCPRGRARTDAVSESDDGDQDQDDDTQDQDGDATNGHDQAVAGDGSEEEGAEEEGSGKGRKWPVERLLDKDVKRTGPMRKGRRARETWYQVKWANFGHDHDSWQRGIFLPERKKREYNKLVADVKGDIADEARRKADDLARQAGARTSRKRARDYQDASSDDDEPLASQPRPGSQVVPNVVGDDGDLAGPPPPQALWDVHSVQEEINLPPPAGVTPTTSPRPERNPPPRPIGPHQRPEDVLPVLPSQTSTCPPTFGWSAFPQAVADDAASASEQETATHPMSPGLYAFMSNFHGYIEMNSDSYAKYVADWRARHPGACAQAPQPSDAVTGRSAE